MASERWSTRRIDPTPEIVDKLCEAAAEGLSIPSCAAVAGVGLATLQRWLAKASELEDVQLKNSGASRINDAHYRLGYDEKCLRDLAERWDIAVAQGCLHLERRADDFGERDKTTWTQPWTKLERMHRAYYGKRDEVEHKHQMSITLVHPLVAGGGTFELEEADDLLELQAGEDPGAAGVP